MTPRPNFFGWLILGAFAGGLVYAFTGKAKAALGCKITEAGVKKFSETQDVATIWLPDKGPPDAESVANSTRIFFPDLDPIADFDSPVIVIDKSETFYRYRSTGPGEVTVEEFPRAKEDYCRINMGG